MCFFGGMGKMSFSSKNFFFGVQQRWKLGGNYYMDRREWESDVFWARECLNHLESHSMLFGGFYWDWFYGGWLHNMRNAHSYPKHILNSEKQMGGWHSFDFPYNIKKHSVLWIVLLKKKRAEMFLLSSRDSFDDARGLSINDVTHLGGKGDLPKGDVSP